MIGLDTPGINELRSPEENMLIVKGWAEGLVDELNYQLLQMQSEIESLRSEISQLKEVEQ
jgi:hypothetical protein